MKFKLFVALIFTIATTFTALHEIEHVENHDSSTCQVCIVDNHSVSLDVIDDFKDVELYKYDFFQSKSLTSKLHINIKSNHSRAPPLIS